MKKILILAYDFPPYISVGGLRPFNWYKYLKEFGIEPIVVTRQWEGTNTGDEYIEASTCKNVSIEKSAFGTIVKTPYFPNFPNRLFLKYGENKFRLARKVCTAFFEVTQFLWNSGPKKQLYHAADAYLKNNKEDLS